MQERAGVVFDVPLPEERVFRYQAMQDVLHHLVNHPFEAFTQRELATVTGADVSSISRSVDLLDRLGVLDVDDGRPNRIRIRQDHLRLPDPVFAVPQPEFRAPVRAFLDELRERIEDAADVTSLVAVVLFGSVARGTADRRSDIDLLLVLDGDATHARRIGHAVARDLERETFDGERYQFEALVETPDSAASHGENLREILDEGLVLERSDAFRTVENAVYTDEPGAN